MAARTLQELVVVAASGHSDRVAVTYDDGSPLSCPVTLLYSDLVQLSGELSRIIRKNCSPNYGVIGLYCSDDLFIPVWVLGILQSSAAYVPLEPETPGLLSARVMSKCRLKYCAVKTDLLQRFQASLVDHMSVKICTVLPKFKLTMVLIRPRRVPEHNGRAEEAGAQTADGASGSVATKTLKEDGHRDLAYVLHTSGTTGLPKIVRVPHKCILPNILHLRSLFQMSADDVVFLASPLTFDPSVVEMFLALSSGAQLLVVPSLFKKTPSRLAQLLFKRHKTTVMQVTPTLLIRFGQRTLKEEVLSSASPLRVLALGGEACPPPALLRSWKQEHNKTSVYNIYGITEVSCWACCHKIPESVLHSTAHVESFVPLGAPLMDTHVEVRDDQGGVVTDGEGQVFIGGEERVCLLDLEETLVPGTMRATGDWVKVRGEQLQYLGRRDRLIKRHGKRVSLDSVQQLILSLPQVDACAVGLHEGFRLLAFVVPSRNQPVQQQQRDHPEEEEKEEEKTDGTDSDLRRLILNRLSLLLPSHSVPDTLLLIPALPLTPHGKVDVEALMTRFQTQRKRLQLRPSPGDVSKLKQTVQFLWQEVLGLPEDGAIDEDANFLLSGGDSVKALHLCEDILTAAGAASADLLEVVLDGTFSDVLSHVTRAAQTATLENRPLSPSGQVKRPADIPPAAPTKRERKESVVAEETWAVKVLRRAGEVMDIKIPKTIVPDDAIKENNSSGEDVLDLRLSWSSDTGRCVDASPVLLLRYRTDQSPDEGKPSVIIGSHSHRIQALDLISGSLVWERVLGGRIEASAAVSHCGSLVVVGCYDSCVYFLCASSGDTRWIFKTGDAVKSSPAVDPVTGLVIVGSHDGTVYALKPEVEQCVWRQHCGGGAVYSSPYLHTSLRQLYVASLGGRLLCLNPDSGEILWSYRRDVPFFSSPNGSTGRVLIGSVDGNICCLSSTGKLMWEFLTNGPVFSSPCVTAGQVLCGSHDGCLYCLNGADGSLVWSFQTTGKVFSSPCVFDGSAVGRRGTLVGLASTDGMVWILDGQDGRMLASFTLKGELFSSPVVWGRSLVVGCRNDFVYCLNLTVKDEITKE